MGQTLENGIYLPSEGERNCYDGLASNWRSVDTNIGYISALRQAIAGALTRKIVTELPTEDIDPNCIYMILKTTPQTNNVYNEWMYISNAWELIGDTQLDLSDYYTKQEVDQLPAVASGVTSTKVGNYDTHIADGDIHVTASDKTKWNTVALIKQLRLINTQVGSATTIAFANIDDTNGIKVGDKCMDLDGKMFEISAVDTTNQTVTVGTALIDLALDANVVHTSGNETVGGIKNFTDDTYVKNINFTKEVASTSASTTSVLQLINTVTYTDQTADKVAILNFRVTADGVKAFYPNENNQYSLGLQSRKWSEVRAIQYYYGSSDTEFSQKFVTTDTSQSITGAKTFNSDLTVANTDTTANIPNLNLRNYKVDRGTTDTGVQTITFLDKNAKALTLIESRRISNGNTGTNILTYNTDDSNNTVSGGVSIIKSKTDTNFAPTADNAVTCGRPLAKWSGVYSNEYYYGANDTPFTDKFVTTDTDQTISSLKTFTGLRTEFKRVNGDGVILFGNGSFTKGSAPNDTINICRKYYGDATSIGSVLGYSSVTLSDNGNKTTYQFYCIDNTAGSTSRTTIQMNYDKSLSGADAQYIVISGSLLPSVDNSYSLGNSTNKWATINGLEPSSLGMPDLSNGIDISSYITHLDKVVNSYTPTVNGWISIRVKKTSLAHTSLMIYQTGGLLSSCEADEYNISGTNLPVIANQNVEIYIYADALVEAKFFPCQGNV